MSEPEPHFRVVFNGNTTGEYDLETTKERFKQLFKLSDRKVSRAFAASELVIKENVTEPVAMHYAIKIAEAGCECYIEEMFDENDPTLDPDFVERRKGERRVFPGSLANSPSGERRRTGGRRKEDQPA